MKKRWWLLIAAGLALSLGTFVVGGLRWRVQVTALKVAGRLPDLEWGELVRFFVPGNGVSLAALVTNQNPYEALRNWRTTPGDVAAGREIFARQCSECHGADARGRSGPDLTKGVFPHGATDWALFRTIERGVPGTNMGPHALGPTAVWQLVAFVRSVVAERLAGEGGPLAADPSHNADSAAFDVTFDRIRSAPLSGAEWPTYSGSFSGQRHSRLAEINRTNVARLRLRWMFQLPTSESMVENTPLVVGNTMFVTLPPNNVWALDARTGDVRWTFATSAPSREALRVAYMVHRGLAILGNTLFLTTSDAHLIALNAQTGKALWDVQVADYKQWYSMTSAPLAIDGKVIVGVAGGERGIRGFIDAYSAVDGRRLWRFYTVPAPGEPGSETWTGDSWKKGGAPTWLTGSYDPDLGLIYWGVGNPGPDFNGDERLGDNLYSNCVVALDAKTGTLRWYFQFTPHDEHDWDAVQVPVLADAMFRGEPRKLIYWANRNGFYYVLDRVTGTFLHATPFAKVTWATGVDARGRPLEVAGARPSRAGVLVYPGIDGATNWWSPSYDSTASLFFVPVMEGATMFFKGEARQTSTGLFVASHIAGDLGVPAWTAVRALDAATGALRWEYRFPPRERSIVMGGVLSTAGGIVFGGDMSRFVALDAATGAELWHFNTGAPISAAAISYLSGRSQNVAIVAGRAVLVFSLDSR